MIMGKGALFFSWTYFPYFCLSLYSYCEDTLYPYNQIPQLSSRGLGRPIPGIHTYMTMFLQIKTVYKIDGQIVSSCTSEKVMDFPTSLKGRDLQRSL